MPVLAVAIAAACPDCPTIRAARAAVLDDPALWPYVLGTLAPFAVLAGLALALARHRPGPRRS